MKTERWKPFFGSRLLFATLPYCDKDNITIVSLIMTMINNNDGDNVVDDDGDVDSDDDN